MRTAKFIAALIAWNPTVIAGSNFRRVAGSFEHVPGPRRDAIDGGSTDKFQVVKRWIILLFPL